ncbi:unnamed protein product [Schistosoma margrebowiei]|uniref:Helicase ATP-binding domain-containing protein n=1 Tax=Schistosoma margrebowiei TaxID=48269 RepID=A0AA85AIX0_9TREM|nr:unnamed protein product [Schistosoma margrebowiei]
MDHLIKSCESLVNPTCSIKFEKLVEFGLTGIVIREYQLQGINWLINCDLQNHGGLLCDEMGLGKTCQVICFILAISNWKSNATFLIVSPLSVIENWRCELQNIAPNISFMTYIGDKVTRSNLRSNYNKSIKVLLTTYEICINDEAFFKTFYWNYVIIDEGHRLKNSNTQLYSMLNETCLGIRFILTGTPVQNNLEELFNLLHFVAPNYFHGKLRSTFLSHFGNTDKNETDQDMAKILRPFLLRRIKQNVLTDLPPRADILIYHSLTSLQTQIYRALLTRNADLFQSITGQHNNDLRIHNRLQNLIMNLRKCVNHPYLFDGIEPEPFTLGEHLIQTSSKLFLLDLLLQFLYNPNHSNLDKSFYSFNLKPVHKVLIFSQMTRMLDIIQDYMTLKGYSYERLDGSVRGEDRFQAVKSFNEDQETFVFLLSTRAGGQGLNLVSADTVIFVDNDFNPQIDVQAAGRAHRIGQTKPVRIIRLVCRHTVEEAILSRAETKLKLATRVLNTTDLKNLENKTDKPFTFDELNNVLKFGLAKLLKTTDNDVGNNNEDDKKVNLNFTQILGETDHETGHWLPVPPSTVNNGTLEEQINSCGWVLLTNEPFHCEPSEADQEAVKKLQQDYELTKSKLSVEDDELLASENITGFGVSNSTFTKLNKHRKKLTPEEIEARNKKAAETKAKREYKRKENEAIRSAERLERKLSLWQSVGYKTFSVFRDESTIAEVNHYPHPNHRDQFENVLDNDNDFRDEIRNNMASEEFPYGTDAGIYYKIGDASEPLSIFSLMKAENKIDGTPPYFVCTTIDNSGHWSHGGIFRALDRRSNNKIKDAYELAGQMDDLNLGDCLIVPIENPDNSSSSSSTKKEIKTFNDYLTNHHNNNDNSDDDDDSTKPTVHNHWSNNFSGLLIAQKHSSKTYSTGEAPDLQLNALEKSLCALGMACARLKLCSVHIPRLGHGTQAFTWYKIERLLRKHLVDHHHISVYVYYYRPVNADNHHSSDSCTTSTASCSSTSTKEPFKSLKRKISSSENKINFNQNLETMQPAKYLYNLFTGKSFYIDSSLVDGNDGDDDDDVKKLKRIIIAYDGVIVSNLDSSVTHIIYTGKLNQRMKPIDKEVSAFYTTNTFDC